MAASHTLSSVAATGQCTTQGNRSTGRRGQLFGAVLLTNHQQHHGGACLTRSEGRAEQNIRKQEDWVMHAAGVVRSQFNQSTKCCSPLRAC